MLDTILRILGLRKPIFGMDYIGGAKYSTKIARNHPEGWAAGFLWDLDGFGKADKAIKRLASTGKAPIIRVHLIWHDNHKFGESDIRLATKRAGELLPIIKQFPDITWLVSPFLEATTSKEIMQRAVNRVSNELEGRAYVVSNGLKAIKVDGAVTEMHHTSYKRKVKGMKIFSFDGLECVDANVTKWRKRARNADLFFFWRYTFNGKFGPKDKRKRKDRTSYPSDNDILSVIALSTKRGKVKLPKGWTFKTHAERHENFSSRANKPVLLTNRRLGTVDMRAGGNVISKASYTGQSHGSHIYRFDEWGYKSREESLSVSGTPRVSINSNGRLVATVNPAFRSGRFLG